MNPLNVDDGPIGLACASNAPGVASQNVGPRVNFEDIRPLALSDLRRALSYMTSDEGASAISQYGDRQEMARILNGLYQGLMPLISDDRCREERCLNDVSALEVTPNQQVRASRARDSTRQGPKTDRMDQQPQRPRRRARSYPPPAYDDVPMRQKAQGGEPNTGARPKR